MLFSKRQQKAIRIIWAILSVLIILSMVLFFAPALF